MTFRLRLALGAIAASLVLAPAAQAQVPVPVTTKYFFQCAGSQPTTKVQTTVASWNTTAPTGSYTAGNGCGFVDTLAASEPASPPSDAVFEGTHTGPVSSITLDLHELLLSNIDAQLGGQLVGIGLEIDGNPVATTDTALTVPLIASSTGASNLMRVTFTNIKVKDAAEHTYRVIVQKYNTAALWVWGASEIASGVEFNPVKAASFKIVTS